jgi:hypothetical protein
MAQKYAHRGLLDCRHGISLAFFRFRLHLRWVLAIEDEASLTENRIQHTAFHLRQSTLP